MKTIEDFTPEIRSKIDRYKSIVRDNLYSGKEHDINKREDTVKYIEYLYQIAKFKKPVVIVAKNPNQYRVFFELIKKNKGIVSQIYQKKNKHSELRNELYSELHSELYSELHSELYSELDSELDSELYNGKQRSHWLHLCSIYSRVHLTWYKFIKDEFKLKTSKEKELDYLYSLVNKTFISRCFFTKGYVLVLKTPKRIDRNTIGFHNTKKSAIEFEGGYEMYYVNGRKVTKDIVEEKFTLQDFLKEDNEDIKASMITVVKENRGQKGLLDFLGAKCIDEKKLNHKSGHKEILRLFKTKESFSFLQDRHGNMNQPYCWSEMKCPSTGSVYLIENSADFTCAIEAAKFLRPDFVPMELEYNFQEFNN